LLLINQSGDDKLFDGLIGKFHGLKGGHVSRFPSLGYLALVTPMNMKERVSVFWFKKPARSTDRQVIEGNK
jgi:hypothetical protein